MPIPAVLKGRLELPVIASPMFIVSGPELVIAQCKAGIVGSFPSLNARPSGVLDEWLTRIERELADYQAANPQAKVAPYAVNLIVHASNPRLEEDIAVCASSGSSGSSDGVTASGIDSCSPQPNSSALRSITPHPSVMPRFANAVLQLMRSASASDMRSVAEQDSPP